MSWLRPKALYSYLCYPGVAWHVCVSLAYIFSQCRRVNITGSSSHTMCGFACLTHSLGLCVAIIGSWLIHAENLFTKKKSVFFGIYFEHAFGSAFAFRSRHGCCGCKSAEPHTHEELYRTAWSRDAKCRHIAYGVRGIEKGGEFICSLLVYTWIMTWQCSVLCISSSVPSLLKKGQSHLGFSLNEKIIWSGSNKT